MPRPTKHPDEQRSVRLSVRYTAAERVFLEDQSVAAGTAVSDLIRRRSLGLAVQPRRARADAALLSELNAIGVNLNQIARNLNAARSLREDAEVALSELRGVIARVLATESIGEDEEQADGA